MHTRFATLAAAVLLASCSTYTAPNSVVYGTDVVTQYKPQADFATYQTFSVDPTVVVVDGTGTVSTTYVVDGTFVAANIADHMRAANYEELAWPGIGTPSTADLQIKLNAALGSQAVYYPGYCGWYPYYYGCYPSWTYAGSYSFGTLTITMGDAKNSPPPSGNANINLVWNAALYGVLSSYYTGTPGSGNNVNWGRINAAVDQAFADSPYITRPPIP
ncbi:MAG TPA: DUF4136 domain-containing protein [Anaeromyxobacteraceae bacterium]|nr:DUF4136 domain-containing protein [Anaeromyxobacteraceae bacterium]